MIEFIQAYATPLTIWFIGWLFYAGFMMSTEGVIETKLLFIAVAIILWPFILGMMADGIRRSKWLQNKDANENSDNT